MRFYRAVYDPNGIMLYKDFMTVEEAESWLDSQNNNLETCTIIEEYLGDDITDWFYYTQE